MNLDDFALHYNLTDEQRQFVVQYGYNEVADRLDTVPESLSESFIRCELAKLRRPENVDILLEAAEEVKNDPYTLAFYNYSCYYWWERKRTILYGNKLPAITQRPVNTEKSGTYLLLVALAGFSAVEKSYAALGLPPEIASDTLQYITGAIDEYAAGNNNRLGIYPNKVQWMRFYVDGKLFRIGRLEYMIQDTMHYLPIAYRHNTTGKVIAFCRNGWELDKNGLMLYADTREQCCYKTAAVYKTGNTLTGIPINPAGFAEVDRTLTIDLNEYTPIWSNGDLVPGVHIPGGGNMTQEACRDSLRRAAEFFKRYFKREVAAFSCFSWIFNTQFEEELPDSNLAKFMRQLYLLPFPPTGTEGLFFIFGRTDYQNWRNYPQDNTLRKTFYRIQDSGRRLRGGAMFIDPRGIENFGQMIYRKEFAEF